MLMSIQNLGDIIYILRYHGLNCVQRSPNIFICNPHRDNRQHTYREGVSSYYYPFARCQETIPVALHVPPVSHISRRLHKLTYIEISEGGGFGFWLQRMGNWVRQHRVPPAASKPIGPNHTGGMAVSSMNSIGSNEQVVAT